MEAEINAKKGNKHPIVKVDYISSCKAGLIVFDKFFFEENSSIRTIWRVLFISMLPAN